MQISYLEYGKLTGFFSLFQKCNESKIDLRADNYNISNNFTYINQNRTYYSMENIYDIKSSMPNNELKCLVCYREEINASCLIFDI